MNENENPPLPDLHQSEVDEATLRQLFTDVGTHTEIIEIIPKHALGYVAESPESLQLDEAYKLLVSRSVRGLQLRYRHDGKTWWDTLMPLPGGLFRIVRIEHDFS
ncbi:MAG: hypothetical protein KDN05_00195 [Verrucomicrobiae bacterium]|nr:hypothetical protein [Verrucomicrobiae bacterium]